MSKQELLNQFAELLNLDVLEVKQTHGAHIASVVEPDDYAHDFTLGIQHVTAVAVVFFVYATPQTERILKASGLPYQDCRVTLGKYLVTI
jgi:hypothetical protein